MSGSVRAFHEQDEGEVMSGQAEELVAGDVVDDRQRWLRGTAVRLARERRLRGYQQEDGRILFLLSEVAETLGWSRPAPPRAAEPPAMTAPTPPPAARQRPLSVAEALAADADLVTEQQVEERLKLEPGGARRITQGLSHSGSMRFRVLTVRDGAGAFVAYLWSKKSIESVCSMKWDPQPEEPLRPYRPDPPRPAPGGELLTFDKAERIFGLRSGTVRDLVSGGRLHTYSSPLITAPLVDRAALEQLFGKREESRPNDWVASTSSNQYWGSGPR
jgi:hypothetical protein